MKRPVFLACLVLAGGAMGSLTLLAGERSGVLLPVEGQTLTLRAEAPLRGTVDVLSPLGFHASGQLETRVPFRQTLTAPLRGRYPLHVRMKVTTPVSFMLDHDQNVPVSTILRLTAYTHLLMLSLVNLHHFPVVAWIPVHLDLPVHLHTRINTRLSLTLDAELGADLDQDLRLQVDTVFTPRIGVDQALRATVVRPFRATVAIQSDFRVKESGLEVTAAAADLKANKPTPRIR